MLLSIHITMKIPGIQSWILCAMESNCVVSLRLEFLFSICISCCTGVKRIARHNLNTMEQHVFEKNFN